MKTFFPMNVLALSASALSAFAASDPAASSPSGTSSVCKAQAAEKKLAGAAKNSFVKKCVGDAKE